MRIKKIQTNKLYNFVPSDMDELNSIKQKIKHVLCRYNESEHIITVEEMKKAISKLCGKKVRW